MGEIRLGPWGLASMIEKWLTPGPKTSERAKNSHRNLLSTNRLRRRKMFHFAFEEKSEADHSSRLITEALALPPISNEAQVENGKIAFTAFDRATAIRQAKPASCVG
jgi:hypothetical protein